MYDDEYTRAQRLEVIDGELVELRRRRDAIREEAATLEPRLLSMFGTDYYMRGRRREEEMARLNAELDWNWEREHLLVAERARIEEEP